ncbi:MAG: hypothetical protein CMH25_03920 [Micavibrio sp.]|nr:hypothetical protein [Micavibrio sp.]|tara:strand:+ start:764812 stop:765732 length:921 start_codon:yes stop_codon:yes gene_type:complete
MAEAHEQFFRNDEGTAVRFKIFTPTSKPMAVITFAEGRAESLEKYDELITFFLNQGYACAIFDWPGQGGSDRGQKDAPQKHSTPSYPALVATLKKFREVIIPRELDDAQKLPHVLFAHSMGAHLSLLYMADKPNAYQRAVLSSPMIRFNPLGHELPLWLDKLLVWIASRGKDESFMVTGGKWTRKLSDFVTPLKFTHDAKRGSVLPDIFGANPVLQVGDWDKGTLKEAFRSTLAIQNVRVETPLLMLLGEKDTVINVTAAKAFAEKQPHCDVQLFENGLHELHMEEDATRKPYMKAIETFFDKRLS